jgi:hypothetical protein
LAKLDMIIAAGVLLAATVATAQPQPETPGSSIGYPTVAAALGALRARSDVRISVQGGWTIADDRANNTLWSFAPEGYPAYPAAVKRHITEANGGIYIDMNILCQASKTACDKLVVDFQKLNESVKRDMGRPH